MRRDPVYLPEASGAEDTAADSGIGYETPQPVVFAPATEPEPETAPQAPTWEPIDENTPRDGYEIAIRYGDGEDAQVRRARWKMGRRFNGRRWEQGGTWVPSDGVTPLPAEAPTHWLKPPDPPEAESEEEAA
jgi:hypothetical protein